MIDMPMPASPQNSSSLTSGRVRPLSSAQNWAIASKPYRPILAASSITGHGVSSRSSHSSAAGRTTPSAKPCTHSRMSFWSWLSSSVNLGSPSASDVELASSSSALTSTSATEESAMEAKSTWNDVVLNVAKIEGAQALATLVGAVEEAAIDAAVGLALSLIGLLDRELAVGQWLAGHL